MKRENLVNARSKAEYTQKGIAEIVGITERQYQGLESGTSRGSIKVWEKLKTLLGAPSIDWLLQQSGGVKNGRTT
ncbi:MAG: helix-turn-helix domain-containing protein [Acidaminococcales bacterium]|jgi:DNA-binding XRE family transcriptional regulator|nr:helix-turn-helix domain-containing protein [Acidaminococcales bacterium]